MPLRTQNIEDILFGTRSKIPHTLLNKSKNNRKAMEQHPNVRKSYAVKDKATKNDQSTERDAAATTFKSMQKEFEKKASRLAEIHCRHGNTSFDKDLVRSVLAFVQLLPKYQSDRIDQDVFVALLSERFNLTNLHLSKSMFFVLVQGRVIGSQGVEKYKTNRGLESLGTLSVETLTSFLCALLADNSEAKAEIVFNVFDHNSSGSFSHADIYLILAPMFDEMNKTHPDEDEDEDETDKRFLIQCIIDKLDADGDGSITLEEFTSMAKIDRSVMYFFGPLLPDDNEVDKFRAMLTGKSPFIVKSKFRNERRRLLRGIQTDKSFIQSLYPIELEDL